MAQDREVFSLNAGDIQCVAKEQFGRELSEHELEVLEAKVDDYIHWYDCVTNAIQDLFVF